MQCCLDKSRNACDDVSTLLKWSLALFWFRLLPTTYYLTRHINVNIVDVRISTVGLPSPSGQVSSKTASTIVRNSNAVASAVDYANGSGSPFKTISVDADLSSTHAVTTDPSSNMTGKTLHTILNEVIIFTCTCFLLLPSRILCTTV